MTQAYGYEVLEVMPSVEQDPSHAYSRTATVFDASTGKITSHDRSGVAIVKPAGFNWVMFGRPAIDEYKQFIDRCKGACNAFWSPSWKHDLVAASPISAGSATLRIQKSAYTQFMWPARSRRYLAFVLLDGSQQIIYRKVIASQESGATEILTLDNSVLNDKTVPAGQMMISFLQLVRLAADDPQLTWINRDVAEAMLDFVELPMEVPA